MSKFFGDDIFEVQIRLNFLKIGILDYNQKWELGISLDKELIKEGSPNQQLVFMYFNLRFINDFKFFKFLSENESDTYIFLKLNFCFYL